MHANVWLTCEALSTAPNSAKRQVKQCFLKKKLNSTNKSSRQQTLLFYNSYFDKFRTFCLRKSSNFPTCILGKAEHENQTQPWGASANYRGKPEPIKNLVHNYQSHVTMCHLHMMATELHTTGNTGNNIGYSSVARHQACQRRLYHKTIKTNCSLPLKVEGLAAITSQFVGLTQNNVHPTNLLVNHDFPFQSCHKFCYPPLSDTPWSRNTKNFPLGPWDDWKYAPPGRLEDTHLENRTFHDRY